jgi:hypothetical protein
MQRHLLFVKTHVDFQERILGFFHDREDGGDSGLLNGRRNSQSFTGLGETGGDDRSPG